MVRIGTMFHFRPDFDSMDAEFARLEALSLNACQLSVYDGSEYTQEIADKTLELAKRHNVEITAVWAGWSGPAHWNFTEGPTTLGFVPELYRLKRMEEIKGGARFAKKLGVTDVITHAGFLPENYTDTQYGPVAAAIRDIAETLAENGQWFLFETGQETPITMLRYIEEVNTGNLGINLDTANLILYGKANTVDALEVFGKYVRNTHFKDGFYPTDGLNLGRECPLGQGRANVPGIIAKLKELDYKGPYIIEREISGEQQTKDIAMARDLILSCLG